ncbi:aspartate aminotransferase family protein [Candidatus Micrarchaeota archaeon]|jgi:acetylornithine/succinyldiaminopimelate/putrescine aminotransferase|nr:aspartate aminotransferase family protein [Candidatus Micrarchaeota archaeon]
MKNNKEEFLFRDRPAFPIEVVNSDGSYLIDKNGKKYLDFVMGWCVGNAGWKKQEIINRIKKFDGPEYVAPTYLYERWEILAEKIVKLMPDHRSCFRATGGTEANEIALKMSRAYNKRKKFIAFQNAYHGQSIACHSLVRMPHHEEHFGKFSDDYIQIKAGEWEKTTEETVKLIKTETISAFISEPLICNLGVVIPPKEFFDAVTEVCKETDTLFICDEVATGFGRTGKWFGLEHFSLNPDIITIAKGFSSGYGAIGATVAKTDVAEAMRFEFSNYSTYGWHPLAVETALSNIDYLMKNNLILQSEKSGKYMMDKISEFCEVEGKGLCIGIKEENPGTETRCRDAGLIISALEGKLVLFPALDVSKTDMDKGLQILKENI